MDGVDGSSSLILENNDDLHTEISDFAVSPDITV